MYFAGEDSIIYSCGKHIVEYDIIRKKQTYIMKNIDDETITAMNYYASKRKAKSIAVALMMTDPLAKGRVLP